MKTNYTIKNFRVFDKKGVTVELSPLSFLVGCNSSGKSSIVKSLSLLKAFFMNDFSSSHPVVGSIIDFSVKPIDTLGSFNNVVRSSSREKTISLSYTVHSSYIDEDVVVTITLGNGNLGNAVITGIQISLISGSILVATGSGAHPHSSSLVPIKDAFKQYLIATRFRTSVNALMPRFPDEELSQSSKQKIEQLETEALLHCDPKYLGKVYRNRGILSPCDNEYAQRAIDIFANSDVMTYFSVLNEIGEMSDPEEVGSILKSKVKEGSFQKALLIAIDFICKDFQKRKSQTFLDYYRFIEDNYLLQVGKLPSSVLKGNNDFGWVWNGPFHTSRVNTVDTISRDREVIAKIDRYILLYDVLSFLSEEDNYSFTLEDDFGYELCFRRIFPLYTVFFNDFINNFILEVVSKDITEGLDYISSSRIQVRRMYPMEDHNEFSEAVRKYFETKTKFMTLDPPIKINAYGEDGTCHRNIEVSDFVPGSFMSKWLKVFSIGDHMSLEMDKNGLGLLLKVYQTKSDKKGVLLADMGYGITQLFSILLQIEEMIMSNLYLKYKGHCAASGAILGAFHDVPFKPRTVAIEEPEIHLHPKYQSLLAEMFYEAYKEYNIQFIIETHSEYLLRKVQTLIGAKKLSSEEVSMIYVEDDIEVKKGAPKIRRIPVKDDGRLAEPFGPGFYDEADSLSMDLLRIKSDMA